MANITAGQVLEQVDALVPNQYTHSEKLRWLAQAEGFVLREVCRVTGKLAELEDGSALSVEAPYDELYRHYVEAQIHYCNGRVTRARKEERHVSITIQGAGAAARDGQQVWGL